MSAQEAGQEQSTAQQSMLGAQHVSSANSFRTLQNLPIPEKKVCQGDLPSNWELFKQRWMD